MRGLSERRLCLAGWLALVAGASLGAGSVSLNGEWRLDAFPQPEDGAVRTVPLPEGLAVRTYRATVPGCCEMELVKTGELPDPLVSTNALAFWAYEGHQWLYTRTFAAPKRVPGERTVLVFEGIDTLADVFLNGEKIGSPENMLVAHEFDVTGKLRDGAENTVQVLIRPVTLAAREIVCGVIGGQMPGGSTHECFRKAPYMYGWDTMPHLAVSGIWRDVRLEVRPAVRIEYPAWMVRWMSVEARTASVTVFFRVVAPFARYYKGKVRCTLSRAGKKPTVSERPFLSPQMNVDLNVEDVDFWWPRGMGEAALYDALIELVDEKGKVLAGNRQKIGLRMVALEYDDRKLPERPGRFLFKVNGTPVFIRGTDWIPLDPIPSRQRARLSDALAKVEDLNCNMIRVWGGGVYEPDEFFDWCDAHGVMVWQDFMMACAVPPQNPAFQAAIREEVTKVVLRFRNHPSLALWSGDNENDLATKWRLGALLAPDPGRNVITRRVVPDAILEHDVSRPYLASSPYMSPEAVAKKAEPAETHMWEGKRAWWKTWYYRENPCWFSSEGGGHGLPARMLLEKVMPAEDVERPWENPDEKDWSKLQWTRMWHYRGTCPNLEVDRYPWDRNVLILRQTAALFGDVPRHDLDLFIEQSQSAQAEAIKYQMERFRSQKFTRKGGFIVWNLQDGWPTVSDAVCDYYGNRKKSYRVLKESQRTVLAMISDEHRLLVVNDSLKPASGRVKVTDAATRRVVVDTSYWAATNSVLDVAQVPWSGQGVMLIDYHTDAGDFRNHYLYGGPPFKWSDYRRWTEGTAAETRAGK